MTTAFPKVGFFRRGYHPEWVDAFFEEARSAYEGGIPQEVFSYPQVGQAAFPLKIGGYDTRAVDAALNRLESAFVQRDRMDFISVNGETGWFAHVAEQATGLYPRLLRPAGQRFSHPDGRERGYKANEVDRLLDRLTAFFDEGTPLDVKEVRLALFSSAKENDAYREDQVDAYLNRVVEILLCAA